MMLFPTRTQLFSAVTLLVLSGVSFATDDKVVGKGLIEKARKISDIRADGAPAFRMEGSFQITPKKGGKEIEGSYSEVWVSSAKWRREVQTDSFHRVEVVVGAKKWLMDSGAGSVYAVVDPSLTLTFPRVAREPEISKVSERQIDSAKVICTQSKTQGSKSNDCVDPGTGVFLVHETLSQFGSTSPHHTCTYRNYEKFGDRLFPRVLRCSSGVGENVQLTIAKLILEPSPDEALFARPPDAVEIGNCPTVITRPETVHTLYPAYPGNVTVVLSTIIGEDGSPRDSKIARSAGKNFDQAALDALRNWRFKPATCDGSPIAVMVNIEMGSPKF
jgi:TonB family protein